MIKCPYCQTPMQLPDPVKLNVTTYTKTQFVATPCCKRGISVHNVPRVLVRPHPTEAREDNWGSEVVASTANDITFREDQYC